MVLTEQKLKDVEECEKIAEKESDFVFSFTRCMRKKGYDEIDVWEAIRYVLGID